MKSIWISTIVFYSLLLAIMWFAAGRFGWSKIFDFEGPGALKRAVFFSLFLAPVPVAIYLAKKKK